MPPILALVPPYPISRNSHACALAFLIENKQPKPLRCRQIQLTWPRQSRAPGFARLQLLPVF